jgi:acetoin utilization deacetylase AcuC-like enzyme
MRVFYTDLFEIPLPEGHRFPIDKYRLLRERIVERRVVPEDSLHVPEPVTREQLERAHDPAYVGRVLEGALSAREEREIGLPWSHGLRERSLRSAGATLAACRAALEDGVSVYLGGGTHHAGIARGAGFCVFNDAAVAVRNLIEERAVSRAVVLDLDVHQGDGTAEILADDPNVLTLSIHGARNYPFRKRPSDIDVPLADGTSDERYIAVVSETVPDAIAKSRADLAIYLAGADPWEGDRLGKLRVSSRALAQRDRLVLGECVTRDVPVAIAMAGGYGRDLAGTVDIQATTVAIAAEIGERWRRRRGSPR